MCAECGCSDPASPVVINLQSGESFPVTPEHPAHSHGHSHGHGHAHGHDHDHGHTLRLEQDVLAWNNRLAERNRGWFAGRNILALNLVSSPGSGKTTLVERTLRDLGAELPFLVIE